MLANVFGSVDQLNRDINSTGEYLVEITSPDSLSIDVG
jgi:hypothetical protein